MPNDFWSGWIILLTLTSFCGLGWFVFSIYMQNPNDTHQTDPVWDEDVREGSHAAPLWWFWLILGMMVFSVLYLMLYPGLGSYAGAFNWSQQQQMNSHQALFNVDFDAERARYLAMPMAELASDPVALESGARLFMDNCAACHGADARGQANAFPDLRDQDWLWGGSDEQIEQSIRQGRNAVMIAWGAVLGEEGVANVADYVATLKNGGSEGHPGQQQYTTFSIACHGPAGEGNPALGGPRLNDDIWLYGGDPDTLRSTIANGRNGQMPAFNPRLDALQIKLLMGWIRSQ